MTSKQLTALFVILTAAMLNAACGGEAVDDKKQPPPADTGLPPLTAQDAGIQPPDPVPDATAPDRPVPDASSNPKSPNDCRFEFQYLCDDMIHFTGHCWCEDRGPFENNGCRELEDARNAYIPDPTLKLFCRVQCTSENCNCICVNKP